MKTLKFSKEELNLIVTAIMHHQSNHYARLESPCSHTLGCELALEIETMDYILDRIREAL